MVEIAMNIITVIRIMDNVPQINRFIPVPNLFGDFVSKGSDQAGDLG